MKMCGYGKILANDTRCNLLHALVTLDLLLSSTLSEDVALKSDLLGIYVYLYILKHMCIHTYICQYCSIHPQRQSLFFYAPVLCCPIE